MTHSVESDVYVPKDLEQALDTFYKKVNPDKETNVFPIFNGLTE